MVAVSTAPPAPSAPRPPQRTRAQSVAEVVAAAPRPPPEPRRRPDRPGTPAAGRPGRRIRTRDSTTRRRATVVRGVRRLAGRPRRGLRRRPVGRANPLRLRPARADHHHLGTSTGAAPALGAADRTARGQRQVRRPAPARRGPALRPRTSAASTSLPSPRSGAIGWTGPQRTVDLPPGRYDTVLPPTAVADFMLYLAWSAGRAAGPRGSVRFSAPGGGTRIGERLTDRAALPLRRPAAAGLESRAVRRHRRAPATRSRSSTTARRSAGRSCSPTG